jgi:cell division protein FtsW (lipid II flippase)
VKPATDLPVPMPQQEHRQQFVSVTLFFFFFFFFFLFFPYAFLRRRIFSFYLCIRQTFGRTPWAGDQSSAKASTHTGQHKI